MSNFGEALIICGHEARTMLLKTCIDLIILLTMSEKMGRLISLMKYGMSRIFK